jgi:hypothetical protein
MALSEYEQRKLDEIERSLHSDDPALATILDSGVVGRQRRVVAAVIVMGGLVALIGGAVTALSLPAVGIVLSVLGFVAMGVGAGLYVSGRAGNGHPAAAGPGADSPSTLSWRTRMEERFQARFDDPGR